MLQIPNDRLLLTAMLLIIVWIPVIQTAYEPQIVQFSNYIQSKIMSLKTILKNIVSKISAFISKILPSTRQMLDIALDVVTAIKVFIDNPAIDVFTALTTTTKDDKVIALLRTGLPKVMVRLKLAIDEAGKTPEQILLDGIKAVQDMDANSRAVTLQSIWVLTSNLVTEDGIKLSDLQKIGQGYYEESK